MNITYRDVQFNMKLLRYNTRWKSCVAQVNANSREMIESKGNNLLVILHKMFDMRTVDFPIHKTNVDCEYRPNG